MALHHLSTGDKATVVGLLPTLLRLSGYLQRAIDSSTGLVSGLMLSTNGDNQYGYDYNTVADAFTNILSANAHRRIAEVATLAGDSSSASTESQAADNLMTQINRLLVTPTGLYVDGLRADGSQSSHSSQQANGAALAYDICPAERQAVVGRYVASLDISIEPDHGHELLRGLHAAGQDDDIVRRLTDPVLPGLGRHPRRRGHLHLGDMDPE